MLFCCISGTDEKMEASLITRLSTVLRDLLRMSKLLTPDDLELDWKKLYDQHERLVYGNDANIGLLCVPIHIDKSLDSLTILCRPYFSKDATEEMLRQIFRCL